MHHTGMEHYEKAIRTQLNNMNRWSLNTSKAVMGNHNNNNKTVTII